MNLQEIFDIIVTHARQQQRKSCSDDACLYRGSEGTKCFIGALIPDEHYHIAIEGVSIVEAYEPIGPEAHLLNRTLRLSGIPLSDRGFVTKLATLQAIHDTFFPEDWELELQRFAVHNGLNYEAPAEHA